MSPFPEIPDLRHLLRRSRAWWYRLAPGNGRRVHAQRKKGFERRAGAERHGETMEDWMGFLGPRGLAAPANAVLVELAVGDGLVGSLGVWLEREGVQCFLWEHRPEPRLEAARWRPSAHVQEGWLLDWSQAGLPAEPWLVTSACSRQSAAVWRAIRRRILRPAWLVIWNPSGRPIWWRRARQAGYRLGWVHQNREYYRPA